MKRIALLFFLLSAFTIQLNADHGIKVIVLDRKGELHLEYYAMTPSMSHPCLQPNMSSPSIRPRITPTRVSSKSSRIARFLPMKWAFL